MAAVSEKPLHCSSILAPALLLYRKRRGRVKGGILSGEGTVYSKIAMFKKE